MVSEPLPPRGACQILLGSQGSQPTLNVCSLSWDLILPFFPYTSPSVFHLSVNARDRPWEGGGRGGEERRPSTIGDSELHLIFPFVPSQVASHWQSVHYTHYGYLTLYCTPYTILQKNKKKKVQCRPCICMHACMHCCITCSRMSFLGILFFLTVVHR